MSVTFLVLIVLCVSCYSFKVPDRRNGRYTNGMEEEVQAEQTTKPTWSFLETLLIPARWFGLQPALITQKDWNDFLRFMDKVKTVRNAQLGIYETEVPVKKPHELQQHQQNDFKEYLKRNAEAGPCGVGKLVNGTTQVDKCTGRNCTIYELRCGSNVYVYGKDTGEFSENCTVSKIACLKPHATNSTDMEIVDLPGANCAVNRFHCNDVDVRPSEIDGKFFTCSVEVLCGHRVFGWESYDYLCESDSLKCNGTIVQDPDSMQVSESCVIDKTGCKTFGHQSTEQCHNITQKCSQSLPDTVCASAFVDHRKDCDPVQSENRCVPHKVLCLGVLYNYSNYNGSLALCEGIQSITCGKTEIPLPFNDTICRIVELSCRGQITPFTNQAAISSNCSVSRVWCVGVPNVLNCTTHAFGCTSDGGCRYSDELIPCSSECVQAGTVEKCACPVDYEGDNCEKMRRMECNMTLINPQKICNVNAEKYAAPKVCLKFDRQSTMRLSYTISCGFKGGPAYNKQAVQADGFKYGFIGDNIALTEDPEQWLTQMKIYHFDYLSDNNQTYIVQLDASHFLGQQSILFETNLSSIDTSYMVGGVIYVEFKMYSKGKARPHHVVIGREVIEITGVPPLKQREVLDIPLLVTVIVMGVLLLGGGGYAIYHYKQKQKQKQEQKPRKQKYL